MKIILASTSPYRARLLQQLRLPFVPMDPGFTETELVAETPIARCRRLASDKARCLADQSPGAPFLVIGADQVASLPDGTILAKPGNFDAAFAQLRACSGRWARFETAVCLLADDGTERIASENFDIRFRELSDTRITRYLNLDQPWDCAGSIRFESLGITLVRESRGRDVNTLLGLPLMLLVDMLDGLDIDVLSEVR